MAHPRRHIGASRRKRHEEDGEDEGSMAGDMGDDSLSEGSVDSNGEDEDADGEVSEDSEDEAPSSTKSKLVNGSKPRSARNSSASPEKRGPKTTVSDTEAMLNGLKVSDGNAAEIHLDNPKEQRESQIGRTSSATPTEPRQNSLASRKRRDNDKYAKEREQNPAFVPTRGSFFLHDKRSTENGNRSSKSKSRPYGLIVDGNSRRSSKADASGGQWAHDLHDTVAGDDKSSQKQTLAVPSTIPPVPTAPRSSPPNRSFSSTTLVGSVPVVVSLPGMASPVHFPAVPKRLHTRLPQHRPPLRRDKPVRISLPTQPPRYIFPAVERSFIFIPRALRPNQVSRGRGGRGGGGWYSGRRPSYYPNSSYTPSVVSRRSSFGMPPSQDGWPSPAGSVYSRPTIPTEPKPVVRLPPPPRPPVGIPPFGPAMAMPLPHPAYRESRPAPIPMHQPRPQKAVSVADIESPVTFPFPFNPPQPQQEQPFHHQVPLPALGINGPEMNAHGPPSQPSATPLSQIPERAIHAAPFQPYAYQQPGYYPPSYPPSGMYYPNSGLEYGGYNGPVGPGASVSSFSGQQQMPYTAGEQPSQVGTVAHESGGTVYFYDANNPYGGPVQGPGTGPGGVVGMGGMMTPPGAIYYPQPGQYYGH